VRCKKAVCGACTSRVMTRNVSVKSNNDDDDDDNDMIYSLEYVIGYNIYCEQVM